MLLSRNIYRNRKYHSKAYLHASQYPWLTPTRTPRPSLTLTYAHHWRLSVLLIDTKPYPWLTPIWTPHWHLTVPLTDTNLYPSLTLNRISDWHQSEPLIDTKPHAWLTQTGTLIDTNLYPIRAPTVTLWYSRRQQLNARHNARKPSISKGCQSLSVGEYWFLSVRVVCASVVRVGVSREFCSVWATATHSCRWGYQGPLLLTWFSVNPSMDSLSVGWNYLSIPKLPPLRFRNG